MTTIQQLQQQAATTIVAEGVVSGKIVQVRMAVGYRNTGKNRKPSFFYKVDGKRVSQDEANKLTA